MYVEKTRSGKYKCVIYVKDFSGKNKKLSVTIDKDTKKNRELALQTLLSKKEKYYNIENTTKVYLYDFMDNEYKEYVSKFRYNTVIKSLAYIRKIKEFAPNIEMKLINFKFCYDLIKKMSEKYSYNDNIKHLKKVLNYAYMLEYIPNIDFLRKLKKIPKKEKEIYYLEKDQVNDILKYYENIDYEFSLIIKFLVLTGLRIGEMITLTFDDVTDDYIDINKTAIHNKLAVNEPKTKSSYRKIILNEELKNIIAYQSIKLKNIRKIKPNFNENNIIFFNNKGGYKLYNGLQKKLSKYEELHLNFHIFRHTHASLLIENGISIDAVARRLGHSDTKITKAIYIHMTKKIQEKENEQFRTVKII